MSAKRLKQIQEMQQMHNAALYIADCFFEDPAGFVAGAGSIFQEMTIKKLSAADRDQVCMNLWEAARSQSAFQVSANSFYELGDHKAAKKFFAGATEAAIGFSLCVDAIAAACNRKSGDIAFQLIGLCFLTEMARKHAGNVSPTDDIAPNASKTKPPLGSPD